MVFLGAFSLQWGMGILIDGLRAAGQGSDLAHRNAFLVLFIIQLAAYLWLLIGGRTEKPVKSS